MPKQRIFSPDLPEPISHFADAVRSGDLLFISGIVSLDRDGNVVSADTNTSQGTRIRVEPMR